MKFIQGFKEIANRYNYFVFDVWAVIHDGHLAYPHVVETLQFLRDQNKKICLLSNAPRRSFKVAEVLKKYGIDEKFYDFILTSGEATFLDLKKNQDEGYKNFGKKYFYVGPDKDLDLLDGLDYQRIDNAENADFLVNTGFDGEHSTIEEKMPQIIEAKMHDLPMICVNPDLIVVKQNGQEMICAGALAHEYEKMSGQVFYYGKPFSAVYKIMMESFGNPKKEEVIAVGDGMETDIKGANSFRIDSVLVTGGILAKQLNIKFWQDADAKKLTEICEFYRFSPQFVISNLKI